MIQPWKTRINPLINHPAAAKVSSDILTIFYSLDFFFFTHSAKFGDNIKFAMHG